LVTSARDLRAPRVGLLGHRGARPARPVHDARVLLGDALEEVGLLEQLLKALRADDDRDDVGPRVAVRREQVRAQRVGCVALAVDEPCEAVARAHERALDATELRPLRGDVGLHRAQAPLRRREPRRRRADARGLGGDRRAQRLGAVGLGLDAAGEIGVRGGREDRHGRCGAQRERADDEQAAK
jgi:hypothetical protein